MMKKQRRGDEVEASRGERQLERVGSHKMNVRADAKTFARDSEISLTEVNCRDKRLEPALSAKRRRRHWNVSRARSHVQQRYALCIQPVQAGRKRAQHNPPPAEEAIDAPQIRKTSRDIFIGALTGIEQLFFIDSLRRQHTGFCSSTASEEPLSLESRL